MKKFFNIFAIAALALFTLQSCLHDDDEVFAEKAAVRINKSVEDVKKQLTSSEQGWLMQYYTGAEYSGAGMNMLMRFDDQYAYVSSDYTGDPNLVQHCTWTVNKDQGPVISFNTYLPILHSLSDPSSAVVDGEEADYEFIVQRMTEDSIFVKGKKWGNKMVMTRVKQAWPELLTSLLDVRAGIAGISKTYGTPKETQIEININQSRIYVGEDGTGVPFVFTTSGIHLQSPVTVDDVEVSNLIYTPGDPVGTVSIEGIGDLTPIIPPLSEQFANGDWFFKGGAASMSARVQSYFDKAVAGSASENEVIQYMYFGDGGLLGLAGYGLTFVSGGYAGILSYSTTPVDDYTVSLKFLLSGVSNGVWYYQNAGYNNVVTILGGSGSKKWKIVDCDNEISPNWLKLQNPSREDEWFVVYADVIANPFN